MDNGILKPMRVVQLIILMAIAGWCLPPAHAAETYAMAQTVNDSIVAPNVFTPNGDGTNDVFEVKSNNNTNVVSLKIYTRAGVLIFSIEAKLCRWDGFSLGGQEMANGVYYYTAEVSGLSPKVSESGSVHLFR